ncbi:hypothetical protein [Paenibacillus thermotolerans]|uniref:hypothetical protein n=1 Tax=Paenibacillus thermotolerans TaxID=3027807 RepID=UPI00236873B5|nr:MULTISPECIES: hypothetical protein [unclassified Paenibacillus]
MGFRVAGPLRSERGSASIESVFVLPSLFLITLLLMLGAVYAMQSGWTYSSAAIAADRTAHAWDNSYKHAVTGMYVPLQQDPLYWRLLHDGAESWFYPSDAEYTASVDFPDGVQAASSLTQKKLARSAEVFAGELYGSVSYLNQGWSRKAIVETAHPFRAPTLFGIRWNRLTAGKSEETIVEPAEYIRNIELVRSYLMMIEQKWDMGTIRNALSPFLDRTNDSPAKGRELHFSVHAEAVRYLRTLVRGRESRFTTGETGTWRLVDALDGQGIAHQAYLGAKSLNTDMRTQLLKDVELLRKGKVKGVVWHFFRRTGTDSAGPNAALRKELEKYGIAIIVHE